MTVMNETFPAAQNTEKIYKQLKINYQWRAVIYSDPLDLRQDARSQKHCRDCFLAIFGIGTPCFTNDFESSSKSNLKEKSLALRGQISGRPLLPPEWIFESRC
ncbi:hypothetical protein H4582DRAFT_1504669 [Lactarius indigo]|nr:hypothetical protein H4582DRAFT_1504669 [Lactarius indigo]